MTHLIKFSLSFLWIFSGLTSVYFARYTGYEILSKGGVEGLLADTFIFGGGALDIIIGIWLISGFYLRQCCKIQILLIIVYSILLTIIDPTYWLHPFGPLTKNIPILVLILVLLKHNKLP